ncbi:MAG: hypothetical protein ACM3ZO_10380 [Clostridia bacterium]
MLDRNPAGLHCVQYSFEISLLGPNEPGKLYEMTYEILVPRNFVQRLRHK